LSFLATVFAVAKLVVGGGLDGGGMDPPTDAELLVTICFGAVGAAAFIVALGF
jgi:hypothetical protein